MVDDIFNAAECGLPSALAVAHLNAQTNLKKLQYGKAKCVQMHVGCQSPCPNNYIDSWTVESNKDEMSSVWDLVDKEAEKHCMEKVTEWKYLGDIIQSNSKCDANIKNRVSKGIGACNQVMQMSKDLCLGKFFFQGALILRAALFLSSLISNSEAWVNLTEKNLADLEAVDEQLLRNILSAHAKTPKELLYLETGSLPVRYVIMSRRITFLHYILCENDDTLLRNFFEAQCAHPIKGDWVSTVKNDLESVGIKMSFEDIRKCSKNSFKDLVKKAIRSKAFRSLIEAKEKHSKGGEIGYEELNLQEYLQADSPLSLKEKRFAFAVRSRGLDLRNNFKAGKSDLNCRLCKENLEDQAHLLVCPALSKVGTQTSQPHYSDMFSQNIGELKLITKHLLDKFTNFSIQVNRLPSKKPSSAAKVSIVNDDIITLVDLE